MQARKKLRPEKTASRDNYTYRNGAGEIVTLGESAQDMKETIALSSDYANGASVDVINGTAGEFSGGKQRHGQKQKRETQSLSMPRRCAKLPPG